MGTSEERAREWHERHRIPGSFRWDSLGPTDIARTVAAYRSAAEAPLWRVLEKVDARLARHDHIIGMTDMDSTKAHRSEANLIRAMLLAELKELEGRKDG